MVNILSTSFARQAYIEVSRSVYCLYPLGNFRSEVCHPSPRTTLSYAGGGRQLTQFIKLKISIALPPFEPSEVIAFSRLKLPFLLKPSRRFYPFYFTDVLKLIVCVSCINCIIAGLLRCWPSSVVLKTLILSRLLKVSSFRALYLAVSAARMTRQ